MVITGLENIVASGFKGLKGKSLAVISNQSAVDRNLTHLIEHISENRLRLKAVLAPEHGFFASVQDMAAVSDDERNGIAFYSLYGKNFESLSPTDEMLDEIECLIFDIQDVGSRYYTFAATLALAMKKASELGIEVVVLDRPNPVNLADIEGFTVEKGFESFVGLLPVPNRHGFTVGELALFANDKLSLGCNLKVVPCKGLNRRMWFDETKLPWVLPSPNMPTPDTAAVYPGMCLIEGTNLSEGRGTTRPFELFGAPFLNGVKLRNRLNDFNLEGVAFRPVEFIPMFQKHSGAVCGGVQIHITERNLFKPFKTGVAALIASRELGGDKFKWRTEEYEFVSDIPAIDLLAGSDYLRKMIERGATLDEIAAHYAPFERRFSKEKEAYHLY
ncbi:MAG: DUF1343 domain-containing protein [Myxococcota bacterium]